MKLRLDNLIYDTTDPSQIEKLESLGAKEIINDGLDYEKMTTAELEELLKSRGISYSDKAKKAELIELANS